MYSKNLHEPWIEASRDTVCRGLLYIHSPSTSSMMLRSVSLEPVWPEPKIYKKNFTEKWRVANLSKSRLFMDNFILITLFVRPRVYTRYSQALSESNFIFFSSNERIKFLVICITLKDIIIKVFWALNHCFETQTNELNETNPLVLNFLFYFITS